jgi:hypothetical protein
VQGGDISNEAGPRIVIVLDDLLLRVPKESRRAERLWVRAKKWKRAAATHVLDADVHKYMWDLIWRSNLSVDLSTFKSEVYAEAIRDRLDSLGVSFGNLMVTTPEALARQMAFLPHVVRVYYAVPERDFMFGDRGVRVRQAKDISL